MPGSQNGWNHSGKTGAINFLMSAMGLANAQRGLGYIRYITEFITQPQYSNLIPIFGIINEPQADKPTLQKLYGHPLSSPCSI
jgi:aryl-phospho-beta-D-glucosidase BglC (GH1 family)